MATKWWKVKFKAEASCWLGFLTRRTKWMILGIDGRFPKRCSFNESCLLDASSPSALIGQPMFEE